MSSYRKLYRDNADTYYIIRQGGAKDVVDLRLRNFSILLGSAIAATFPTVANKDVLAGVITAQSILMGFAFNVMVYISSQDALKLNVSEFREDKLKAIRLNDLADEIFTNLSYYITVGLVSVIVCLIWIAVSSGSALTDLFTELSEGWVEDITRFVILFVNWILRFLLFVSTFESLIVFGRLVRRVTFHFRGRRELRKGG